MNEIRIKILGRTRNEVGDHLELLAKEMLAKMGFGGFIRNAYKTGAEIDLKASHRVTSAPLLCECKAHDRPLGTKPIRLFHSEWVKDRKSDNRLYGIVISIAGFSGTAKQWYSELDQKTRKHFALMDSSGLLEQLVETHLTLDPHAISTLIAQRYSIGTLQEYWLTYSQHGLIWVYIYVLDDGTKYYTMVDGSGQPLPTWKTKELVKLSRRYLGTATFFGLDLRYKVQQELLKHEGATAQAIAEASQEALADVRLALSILTDEKRLSHTDESDQYYFVRDIVQFVNTAQDFIYGADALLFLSSEFTKDMLCSDQFLSYIDSRYQLGMNNSEREVLSRLLLISPSALEHALFRDPAPFLTMHKHVNEIKINENEKAKWLNLHRSSLMREVLFKAIHDLTGHLTGLSSHHAKLGVKRIRIKAALDAIGIDWEKLSVQSEIMTAIEVAGGAIPAGSLVSHSNPAESMMWDGLLFLEIGEYTEAEERLLKATEEANKSDVDIILKQAILNNLALVYMRQMDWLKAENLLKEAFDLGPPSFSVFYTNRALCLIELGEIPLAGELINEVISIFPDVEDSVVISRYREVQELEASSKSISNVDS